MCVSHPIVLACQKFLARRSKPPVITVPNGCLEGFSYSIRLSQGLGPGGVIDARYELRVPTHLELKSWGESVAGPCSARCGVRGVQT